MTNVLEWPPTVGRGEDRKWGGGEGEGGGGKVVWGIGIRRGNPLLLIS